MNIFIKFPDGRTIDGKVRKSQVTVGRSHKADFVITDEAISRIHCLIELQNGQFYITDFDSGNGVFIDGKRIPSQKKVPFNIFMQLFIGPVECFLQDDEEQQLSLETISLKMDNVVPVRRRISRQKSEEREPANSKKVKKSKVFEDLKIIIAFILAFSAFIYFNKSDYKKTPIINETEPPPTVENQGASTSFIPDEFSSLDMYELYWSKKTCAGMTKICEELKISSETQEGLYYDGKELYVYIKPSKLLNQKKLIPLKGIKGTEEIISHYIILTSGLLGKLDKGELDQIHLIMVSSDGVPLKVYRYHVNLVTKDTFDRYSLIESISSSIRNKNISTIYENLEKLVPNKVFPPLNI